MQTYWIKNGQPSLLLFFTGWGMDPHPTLHLDPGERDICVCYDFRSLDGHHALFPDMTSYRDITVIGWSVGVWAADQIIGSPENQILNMRRCIAINGTHTPVHDHEGIPESVFRGTLEHLNEPSLQKFFRRMAGTSQEHLFFLQQAPQRTFKAQKEELSSILFDVESAPSGEVRSFRLHWDTAVICTRDQIFPPANLHQAWAGKTRIVSLDQPHYPFGAFVSWQQMIDL